MAAPEAIEPVEPTRRLGSEPVARRSVNWCRTERWHTSWQASYAGSGRLNRFLAGSSVRTPMTKPIRCPTRPSIAACSSRPRGALKKELMAHLRRIRGMRRSRHHTQKTRIHGRITDAVSISERPAVAEDRALPGHWEGDFCLAARIARLRHSSNVNHATSCSRRSTAKILRRSSTPSSSSHSLRTCTDCETGTTRKHQRAPLQHMCALRCERKRSGSLDRPFA